MCLREEIIKVHHKFGNECGRFGWDRVGTLKQNMESRLSELGGILQELSEVQGKAAEQCPVKLPFINQRSLRGSPDQRQWKPNLNLSDLTGEADGRLPPIIEDTGFPRQSSEYAHIPNPGIGRVLIKASNDGILEKLAKTSNFADSPELGPPPVALFEERDPIRSNPTSAKPPIQTEENAPATLFANLEARKKRRESILQRDSTSKSDGTERESQNMALEAKPGTNHPLKSGAKRKFNVRDEDDQMRASTNENDFQNSDAKFDPYSETIKSRSNFKTLSIGSESVMSKKAREQRKSEKIKDINPSNTRRVLGPKSVNSDPQSPAKQARSVSNDKGLQKRDDIVKRIRDRNHGKDKQTISNCEKTLKTNEGLNSQDAAALAIPPKTPAVPGLDLFSPSTSDPSEQRPELRDTPPPPDLGPDTGTGSFGRASRRSKGGVSYAEPNLRVKMRRPTEDLIDAVGAEEKLRLNNFDRVASESSLDNQLQGTRIKQEDNEGSGLMWKTKPVQGSKSQQQRLQAEKTSPLGKKTNPPAADLPASVMTDRRRRASSLARKGDEGLQKEQGSSASTVIAALSGATHRKRNEAEATETMEEGCIESNRQESEGRTSVFDFTSSSPEHPGEDKSAQPGAAKPLRVARRHSSVSTFSDPGRGSITVSRRRREISTSNRSDPDKTNEPSTATVTASGATKEVAQGSIGRSERAASRRRSMMV